MYPFGSNRGSDALCLSQDERTALHTACLFRSLEAVRALLDSGASARIPDIFGETPLLLAVRNIGEDENCAVQAEIVKALLEVNCRINLRNAVRRSCAALPSKAQR